MRNVVARALLALVLASTLGACARATGPLFEGETGGIGAAGAAGSGPAVGGSSGTTAGSAGAAGTGVVLNPGAGSAGQGGSAGSAGQGGSAPVVAPLPGEGEVYTHTLRTLFRFEPISRTLTKVGDFGCFEGLLGATADAGMNDIAVDRDGNVYGSAKLGTPEAASRVVIVSVDPTTAQCTEVFSLPDTGFDPETGLTLRGLSFVPQADGDQLFGFDLYGRYLRVDLDKKEITQAGSLDPAEAGVTWYSGGADIVSIKGDRTYTTAARDDAGDRLLAIDPVTGAIEQEIGLLGQRTIGGLAYWGGVVYAFTSDGAILAVDTTTGAITQVPVAVPLDTEFQGAGVTTIAPIVIE